MSKPYQRGYRLASALIDSRVSAAARVGTAICCCGLLLLAGCSSDPRGKLYTVKGKITLADGKPCPQGFVTFVPIEADSNAPEVPLFPASEGRIEEDGSYMLFTKGEAGAPVGKYRIALQPGVDKKSWSQVPIQYRRKKSSPLEVEVVADKAEGGYDLKLPPQNGQRR